MKKTNILLVLACLGLMAFIADKATTPVPGILPNTKMAHIGIVVPNIEHALDAWLDVLGLENRPEITNAVGHEDNPTHFRGVLSDAKAKLAFITLENIQVELIEPYGDANSHWKEILAKNGAVVHHAAFHVQGLGETYVDLFKEKGYEEAQKGGWNGGEYSYMDTQNDLGLFIELLEQYPKE
ncbi:MAG: VOC family protein [Maribacter sp.]|uniref:VOC family protein n=1 Tax=Maribacter sp. TaxID=1897614 RepID=UPI003C7241DC